MSSTDARFKVIDSCRHSLLKELQHKFAVASTERSSYFRQNSSKQNQRWWHDQSHPSISGRVMTSREHVQHGQYKYRCSAKDCERKPETHEIPCPARSIET